MGSRYGVRTRAKVKAVSKQKDAKYECTKCGKKSIARAGNSLWICSSCGHTSAGGAYTPTTLAGQAARKTIYRSTKA